MLRQKLDGGVIELLFDDAKLTPQIERPHKDLIAVYEMAFIWLVLFDGTCVKEHFRHLLFWIRYSCILHISEYLT